MIPHGSPWFPMVPHGSPSRPMVDLSWLANCTKLRATSPCWPRWPSANFFWTSGLQPRRYSYGDGSIPIDTFLVGWTSIYQLFWCELQGYKVFDALPYECYTNHVLSYLLSCFSINSFNENNLAFLYGPKKKTLKKSCHVPLFYLDSTSKLWGLPTFPTGSPPQSWRWSEGVGSAPLATAGGCCSCCPLRWWPPRADLLRWTVMGKLRENHGKTMGKWGSNKLVSPWII